MTRTGVVLEMTDSSELIDSSHHVDLSISEVLACDGGVIGDLYRRIWEPIGGGGRGSWTDQEWIDELDQPGTSAWIGRQQGQVVGMAQVGQPGDGDAGFVVIGVLPEFQGCGIGGELLSRLTRHLWTTPAPNGQATTRVWIWTIPDEHPHTIPNYLARGFHYAEGKTV